MSTIRILQFKYLYIIHYIGHCYIFNINLLYLFKATHSIFTSLLAQMYSVLHLFADTASPTETCIGKEY